MYSTILASFWISDTHMSKLEVWHFQKSSSYRSFFSYKIFGGHKSFSWGHWYPCFGLVVTSVMDFKARVNPFLHAFSPMFSPLVLHLLIALRTEWQPSRFDLCTCRHVCKHWWRFGLGLEPTTICVASTGLYSIRPLGLTEVYLQDDCFSHNLRDSLVCAPKT